MESEARAFGNSTSPDNAIRSMKACVVFDSANGAILHVHQVVTLEGADETSDDEVRRRALALAQERLEGGTPLPGEQSVGAVEGELQALQLDPSQLAKTEPHRVDPQTRSLVPTDGPAS